MPKHVQAPQYKHSQIMEIMEYYVMISELAQY